jgi:tetraacyldisaccharide 4'-kinase
MSTHTRYFEIINGTRRGVAARSVRRGLGALSLGYRGLIALRNRWYDRPRAGTRLGVPVISVGNLTTGGTGKTPMTAWLGQYLISRGRKPAVLSRGYKARNLEESDEIMMLRRQCPELVAVVDPDRITAGRTAIQKHGADILILDDGFQHRRLARDLDLVLIDATCPFGYGHLLPRGLLREPLSALKRADAAVITRSDQVTPAELEHLESHLYHVHTALPVLRAAHDVTGFTEFDGTAVQKISDLRIGIFAGIARPESFQQKLLSLGTITDKVYWFEDHHAYTRHDAEKLSQWAQHHHLDALLTTEKDAVKLVRLNWDWPLPVIVVHVRLRFADHGEKLITNLLDRKLQEYSISE